MEDLESDGLTVDIDENRGIATLTLDVPETLNAITDAMLSDITRAIDRCRERDEAVTGTAIDAVVLRSTGSVFSAGYDISQFPAKTYPAEERAWRGATTALESYAVPVIAVIDGDCLGGGLELALSCDFRIASLGSEFALPEVDIGLFPSGGATQRLQPLVGPMRTKELCMTGERIDAETALEDGILTDAVPRDDLDARVDTFLETLLSKPPLAVRAVKDVVNKTQSMPQQEGLAYEHAAYQPLLQTEDYREGIEAFEADRQPDWQGR